MAVVTTNQEVKAKIVYQKENEEGEMRQSTKTISNLVAGASNDALYNGMVALAALIDGSGVTLVRVDEGTLVSE